MAKEDQDSDGGGSRQERPQSNDAPEAPEQPSGQQTRTISIQAFDSRGKARGGEASDKPPEKPQKPPEEAPRLSLNRADPADNKT